MGIMVNIDMPENCFQCPMARGNGECVTCQVTGSSTNTTTKRLDDCPILFGDVRIMPEGGDPTRGYGFSMRSCGSCSAAGLSQACRYCTSNPGWRYQYGGQK